MIAPSSASAPVGTAGTPGWWPGPGPEDAHDPADETPRDRSPRHVLAGAGRVRQRRPGGDLPGDRDRLARRVARLRAHRPDDGVRAGAPLRLPPQPGRVGGAL